MKVLEEEVPDWRKKKIHESSPGGSIFRLMKQQCVQYTYSYSYSYWYESRPIGERISMNGTNQNLENMDFEDEIFDVFITQDVLEHINSPQRAFNEIARTLKKGGIHIFTTPIFPFRKTRARIKMEGNTRNLILPPIYHLDPIKEDGTLVTYEWGNDILDIIDDITGMKSRIVQFPNRKDNFEYGLEGDLLQVVVSKKI